MPLKKYVCMRKILFILLFHISIINLIKSQTNETCRINALKLIDIIEKFHVKPPVIDSVFEDEVFNNFITTLDPKKIYFTQQDYNILSSNKYSIITGLNNKSWNFYELTKSIYLKRLEYMDSLINIFKLVPLYVKSIDSIHFDITHIPVNENEIAVKARQWFTIKVMYEIFLSVDTFNFRNYSVIEESARKKIFRLESGKIAKKLNQKKFLENFVFESFMNAITSCTDPHTSYMSVSEKKSFENEIESENLSFGLELALNENDELVVAGIQPGGPAWKSNAFHKGDIITGFKIEGKNKINIDSVGFDQASDIMFSDENKKIEFYIRKSDGSVRSAVLTKSVLENEDNKVRSCILNGDFKAGYISLPSFYTQFENYNPLGCANDVARECIKLQKENIKGLIIDLRSNGGGSVNEAIDLSGLFIDYGPICIVREKDQKPLVKKDFNRGTVYDGPLVVLVNKGSASASEIFAAAMQDYKRAIIIGSNTFGKATSQVILPCDSVSGSKNNSNGFVKLTVQKIYRITGLSNQKKGIKPDIYLTDITDLLVDGEINENYALENDSVKKSIFIPLTDMNLNALKNSGKKCLTHKDDFLQIQSLYDSLKYYMSSNLKYPENFNEFYNFYKKKKKIIYNFEEVLNKEITDYKAIPLNFNNMVNAVFFT